MEDDETDRDGQEGERDSDESLVATFVGIVSPGEDAPLAVTRNSSTVENAIVVLNDEPVGTTDADGELTDSVPEADTVTVVVEREGDVVDLEYEFG